MRRLSAADGEGTSWVDVDGGDEGGGGERGWVCGGGGEPEIRVRRRLRGGGLTPGDGILLSGQAGKRRCGCSAESILYLAIAI